MLNIVISNMDILEIVLLQGNGRKPKTSVALRLVNRLGTIPRLLASILLHFIQSEVCAMRKFIEITHERGSKNDQKATLLSKNLLMKTLIKRMLEAVLFTT